MPPTSSRAYPLLVGLLSAAALALSLHDARRDSATADEPLHLAAGVAQVRTGTWLVNVEHPPLAGHLFGAAAVAATGVETPRLDFRDYFRTARAWLFAPRADVRPDGVLSAARAAAALVFALLVPAAYLAAGRGMAGLTSAVILVGATALFPHGHLVVNDVLLVLFTLLLAGALRRADDALPWRAAAAAALCLGAALATKYTAVLFVPLAALALLAARGASPRRRALFAVGVPLAAGALLLAVLSFSVRRERPGALGVLGRLYRMPAPDMARLERLDAVHRGAARYAFGLLFQLRWAEGGRLTWFGGPTRRPGPHYHLVALAVKSPILWLAAVAAGAFLAARRGPRGARLFFLGAALLFLGSLPGPRVGVRHVFPAMALLALGAGLALAPWLARLPRAGRAALLAALLAPLAWDRSLGARGLLGRLSDRPLLADSNLDWGQDLLRLRDLLARRGIDERDVSILYFGGDSPALRLPGAADLLESDAAPRRYLAVSRQLLLLGPEAALDPRAAPRAARGLALARAPGTRLVARAGTSIDLLRGF